MYKYCILIFNPLVVRLIIHFCDYLIGGNMSNFSKRDNRRRSRIRMKLEVLKVLKDSPRTISEVANILSTHFYTVRNVMIALKKKGLVEKDGDAYTITEKGLNVIPMLEQIVSLDDEVRRLMKELDM